MINCKINKKYQNNQLPAKLLFNMINQIFNKNVWMNYKEKIQMLGNMYIHYRFLNLKIKFKVERISTKMILKILLKSNMLLKSILIIWFRKQNLNFNLRKYFKYILRIYFILLIFRMMRKINLVKENKKKRL